MAAIAATVESAGTKLWLEVPGEVPALKVGPTKANRSMSPPVEAA